MLERIESLTLNGSLQQEGRKIAHGATFAKTDLAQLFVDRLRNSDRKPLGFEKGIAQHRFLRYVTSFHDQETRIRVYPQTLTKTEVAVNASTVVSEDIAESA
jgi:hypothetical protein